MRGLGRFLNPALAAFLLVLPVAPIVQAEVADQVAPAPETPQQRLDRLFAELADPANENWAYTEENIWIEWSKSGSPAMDLLLQRGRLAMAAGDFDAAIEHLTALIDHDPAFAEGWNARATAYFNAGLFGPSIEDVRHVLLLNPRHFGAMAGLGMMLEEMDDPKDAMAAYEAAHAIHPRQAGVMEAIERLHRQLDGQDI